MGSPLLNAAAVAGQHMQMEQEGIGRRVRRDAERDSEGRGGREEEHAAGTRR